MRTLIVILFLVSCSISNAQKQRPREYGIKIGILKTGRNNAITDVPGVKVGQFTLVQGDSVRTGATAIVPHSENIFQNKIPGAVYIGNGFGKLMGYPQVEELGNIETPIVLTNTLSIAAAADAVIDYTFSFPENNDVRSVNAIVGETNDGGLNDIRKRYLSRKQILQAINTADTGLVKEGNVGAGTGTSCLGFKGGIGTSSRKLPRSVGAYTIGVLVQTNFGGILQINGVPVGIELKNHKFSQMEQEIEDGSCMMVVLTDAPLSPKNLKRLASRAMLGLARTGGIAANGSGDFVIAASTARDLRISYKSESEFEEFRVLRNNELDIIFEAVIEATEEAIINSLFAAETVSGKNNLKLEALPLQETLEILKKYNRLGN